MSTTITESAKQAHTKALLAQYEAKRPHIVFEWKDAETDAEGWVVINSLRGGAAGGGTRMRKGLDRREVESLAKTMEVKFTVCGPAIGGAKSGINFDPADPRKKEVLQRWFKAVYPMLKSYYGTGGDLNVDGFEEVIPITEEFGLWHPQEGIVVGHLKPNKSTKIKIVGQLRAGVSKVVEDARYTPLPDRKYTVTDLITGWGVAMSVAHYYQLWHRLGQAGAPTQSQPLVGKRAIIQGWGNVAAAAGLYLAELGAKIVGILDRNGAILAPEGLDYEAVKVLFLNRQHNTLVSDNLISLDEAMTKVWDMGAEIFVPGAASRLVTQDQVSRMISAGLEVISAGANVPFADREIFMGPIGEFADAHVSVIPDFVANCGMARVFAYLMQPKAEITDQAIFTDTSEVIREALTKVHASHPAKTDITSACFEVALGVLM